jgi:hypothetical protein
MGVDYYPCQCGKIYSDHDDIPRCEICENRVCSSCAKRSGQSSICTNCDCTGAESVTNSTYECTAHKCQCFTYDVKWGFVCDVCDNITVPTAELLKYMARRLGVTVKQAEADCKETQEYAEFLLEAGHKLRKPRKQGPGPRKDRSISRSRESGPRKNRSRSRSREPGPRKDRSRERPSDS